MSAERRAWAVIARMHAELRRQSIAGRIKNKVPMPDTLGGVEVVGYVDLASLADATERALLDAFGEPADADQG